MTINYKSLLLCAYLDLVGSRRAYEESDSDYHDWDGHTTTIEEFEKAIPILKEGKCSMGLDQYLYATSKVELTVDGSLEPAGEVDLIGEWRKHPNLHGWMHKKYLEKGGLHEDFNLTNLYLDLDDLAELEKDILNDNLPETTGFFFGYSNGTEKDRDLEIIEQAKEELKNNRVVYYKAWW